MVLFVHGDLIGSEFDENIQSMLFSFDLSLGAQTYEVVCVILEFLLFGSETAQPTVHLGELLLLELLIPLIIMSPDVTISLAYSP